MSERLFIGKKIIELDVVDSTNSYLQTLLNEENVLEGTLIMAHFQQKGKGQRGNVWQAEPGKNLTFSLLLKPKFLTVTNHFILSKLISLAICKALEQMLEENVYIKWPNDIFVDGKKICGILIENQFKGNRLENAVVGVGLNVNQTNFGGLDIATSLKLILAKEFNLKNVLDEVLMFVESYYLKAKAGAIDQIEQEYLQNLLFFDEVRKYKEGDTFLHGKIKDVLSDGKLKMELQNGETRLMVLKDFEFIL